MRLERLAGDPGDGMGGVAVAVKQVAGDPARSHAALRS